MADTTPQNLDLTPEVVNLEIQQGTDVTVEVQLTRNGLPIDITNDTVKITAKDDWNGTTKIATKSLTPGIHTDPADGKTAFTWTRTETFSSTPKDVVIWKWEVRRVTSGSLLEVVYIHGDLVLAPSVGLSS
jgi:hypothetical protein